MKPTRRPEQGRLLALERATSDHRVGIWAPRSAPGPNCEEPRKALTSELPPITDVVRREENAFAFLVPLSRCEAILIRQFSISWK
jgi:hypothetical protein